MVAMLFFVGGRIYFDTLLTGVTQPKLFLQKRHKTISQTYYLVLNDIPNE